jgi:hypothetical protein
MNRCLYTDDVVRHQLAHGVVRVHVTYLSVPLGSRAGYTVFHLTLWYGLFLGALVDVLFPL